MILKWIFDRVVALIGLLVLWPVLLIELCQGTVPDTRTTMGKKGSPIGLKSC